MAVLIPSAASWECLQLTLASYLWTTPRQHVVVASADADNLDKVKEAFPGVDRLEMKENKGYCSSVNFMLEGWPRGADVVLSNDDVVPLTPEWPALIAQHRADYPQVAAIGARSNYVLQRQSIRHQGPRLEEVPTLSFFWVWIRGEALADVGLLDEQFDPGGWDDIDWSVRARKKGWKLLLDRRILVWHWGRVGICNVMGDGLADHDRSVAQKFTAKHHDFARWLSLEPADAGGADAYAGVSRGNGTARPVTVGAPA